MEWRERQTASGREAQRPVGFVLSIGPLTEDHTVLKRTLYPEDSHFRVAGFSRAAVRRRVPLACPLRRGAVSGCPLRRNRP